MCRFPFCFIQQLLCVESFQVQTLQEKGLKSKKITKNDHSKDLTDKTNIYICLTSVTRAKLNDKMAFPA